jgi:hypothetical protein
MAATATIDGNNCDGGHLHTNRCRERVGERNAFRTAKCGHTVSCNNKGN